MERETVRAVESLSLSFSLRQTLQEFEIFDRSSIEAKNRLVSPLEEIRFRIFRIVQLPSPWTSISLSTSIDPSSIGIKLGSGTDWRTKRLVRFTYTRKSCRDENGEQRADVPATSSRVFPYRCRSRDGVGTENDSRRGYIKSTRTSIRSREREERTRVMGGELDFLAVEC